jgi:hypothetical protein
MDQVKMTRADELEAEARRLRKEAFDGRPMPDCWRVGQKVRYLHKSEWAWNAGNTGTVVEVPKEHQGKPAKEAQWFYTGVGSKCFGRYHTTPIDVELIEDVI